MKCKYCRHELGNIDGSSTLQACRECGAIAYIDDNDELIDAGQGRKPEDMLFAAQCALVSALCLLGIVIVVLLLGGCVGPLPPRPQDIIQSEALMQEVYGKKLPPPKPATAEARTREHYFKK